MAAINFPNSPVNGQLFTANGPLSSETWKYTTAFGGGVGIWVKCSLNNSVTWGGNFACVWQNDPATAGVSTGWLCSWYNGTGKVSFATLDPNDAVFGTGGPVAILGVGDVSTTYVLTCEFASGITGLKYGISGGSRYSVWHAGVTRMQADYSTSTLTNRSYLQTSTVNGNSIVGVLPNGSSVISGLRVLDNSTPTNAHCGTFFTDGAKVVLASQKLGSATDALPLTLQVDGTDYLQIDSTLGGATAGVLSKAGLRQPTNPVPTAGTGAFTTVSAELNQHRVGPAIHWDVTITITTNGTAASTIVVPMGFTAIKEMVAAGRGAAVSGKMVQGLMAATSSNLVITNYDNTYPGATGERITLSGKTFVV